MKIRKFYILLVCGVIFNIGWGNIHPIIKSAILPGWGELELGNNKRANQFFIQETGILLSFIVLKTASQWYEADFRAFASLHAGVDMSTKTLAYATDIGDYNSYNEFVEAKIRNRQINEIWPEGHGYEWNWDSGSNRRKFDKMRIMSGVTDKYATFAIGGMIAHRIISMIDVLYLQGKKNRLEFGSEFSRDKMGGMKFSLIFQF